MHFSCKIYRYRVYDQTFDHVFPAIPYTIRVSTGEGEDNGTESNVWIKIMGLKKKHTGRLFLELAQKNKFNPGSTEIFSIEAVDVEEVKKIEVKLSNSEPITRQQILDSSKPKEFADDNFKSGENGSKLSKQVENIVGKGEIARYKQFLLFPQSFPKDCFPGASKGVIVWKWVKQQVYQILTNYYTISTKQLWYVRFLKTLWDKVKMSVNSTLFSLPTMFSTLSF